MSLRAELIGASTKVPGFALVLPEGWGSFDGEASALRHSIDRALSALEPSKRAALRASLDTLLSKNAEQADRANVIRTFVQDRVPAESFLPISIVASRMDAPNGAEISAIGAQLIASNGAAAMDEGGTILRWTGSSNVEMEGTTMEVHAVKYLLPVPNEPRHGLLFHASILRSVEAVRFDDTGVEAMTALCDAIVSTVRWRRDA